MLDPCDGLLLVILESIALQAFRADGKQHATSAV